VLERVKKGRLRWFEHVECKNYGDWVKCCMTMKLDRTKPREHFRCQGRVENVLRGCTGLEKFRHLKMVGKGRPA